MTWKSWTTTELKRLKEYYQVMPMEWLEKEFPLRSVRAIMSAASRLKLSKRKDWQKIARDYQPTIFSVPNRVIEAASQTWTAHERSKIGA